MAHGAKPGADHPHTTAIPRLALVLVAACMCSCLYAISLVLLSTKPCWSSSRTPDDGAVANASTSPAEYKSLLLSLTADPSPAMAPKRYNTSLAHIVFGIAASAKLWESRRHYVAQWWRPATMRGFVWLDRPVADTQNATNPGARRLPTIQISANTSQFRYTRSNGHRSALRLARIVGESFRLVRRDGRRVDWFVMGDDDTVFFADNLVRVLGRYDPSRMHYVGGQSESHRQNTEFSYAMAYGGGGFAVSYPLAAALAATQDACLHRYPELFGSDDRVHACITELGVPIIKNGGFHQFDIYGDALGLMAAHPLTPLLSIHHLDVIAPLFPNMTRLGAVRRLMRAGAAEQASLLQQTIVYGRQRRWSFSISAGYVVRVYRGFVAPRELEQAPRTFLSWYGSRARSHFPFNVREIPSDACKRPTLFFVERRPRSRTPRGLIEAVYVKEDQSQRNLTGCDPGLDSVERIRVRSEPLDDSWFESRRQCGRVTTWRKDTIDVYVRPCKEGELIIGS